MKAESILALVIGVIVLILVVVLALKLIAIAALIFGGVMIYLALSSAMRRRSGRDRGI